MAMVITQYVKVAECPHCGKLHKIRTIKGKTYMRVSCDSCDTLMGNIVLKEKLLVNKLSKEAKNGKDN